MELVEDSIIPSSQRVEGPLVVEVGFIQNHLLRGRQLDAYRNLAICEVGVDRCDRQINHGFHLARSTIGQTNRTGVEKQEPGDDWLSKICRRLKRCIGRRRSLPEGTS
jgi:hypothetical protein